MLLCQHPIAIKMDFQHNSDSSVKCEAKINVQVYNMVQVCFDWSCPSFTKDDIAGFLHPNIRLSKTCLFCNRAFAAPPRPLLASLVLRVFSCFRSRRPNKEYTLRRLQHKKNSEVLHSQSFIG